MQDERVKKTYYRRYDLIWYFLLFIAIIFIDQVTKVIAKRNLSYTYCSFFFKFSPVINHGIAFGLFSDSSTLNQYFLATLSLLSLVFIFFMFKKKYLKDYPAFIEAMILSASFSNILDRYLYGGIVDFLTINFIDSIVFPVGNIADLIIVFGLCWIIVKFYLNSEKFLKNEIF